MNIDMNRKFSLSSNKVLSGASVSLQMVCKEALKRVDFSVVCSIRTKAEQDELFNTGLSQVRWPNSKHNVGTDAGRKKSDAVDLYIWHPKYRSIVCDDGLVARLMSDFKCNREVVLRWIYMQYAELNAFMHIEALKLNTKLRWGGDWNGKFGILDQKFDDLYHWEEVK